ncbi:MAG TPA: helix-turn-helix domain-containing protein [Myxococcales bacterium]|nr:helix-turn-helix domain-containing protein [Myxococcales bacterium]
MPSPLDWKPRGVLKASPDGFDYLRLAPAPGLAPFVEHFWGVAWDLDAPVVRETLPHPSVHLIFERGHSGVGFVSRKRWVRTLEGRSQVLGVKFHPGCFRPFYPRKLSNLAGRVLPISQVFGRAGAALEKQVLGQDLKSGARLAEAFLLERLPPLDEQAALARTAVARILADPSLLRAEAVAEASGLTLRSLQRLFSDYVGIGPKWVIQRYRLHEAVARLEAGKAVDFARLALDLGYADQAHFIRDFKALVGRTPKDYASS